jgi:hypothetical protein
MISDKSRYPNTSLYAGTGKSMYSLLSFGISNTKTLEVLPPKFFVKE